ncbi:S41 family peptidase [Treponema brennaborense]|uniref:Carboxyl-terminal protease n=1 Tax=Treponema brennaborense (strain DSM 12168 / CIP 105900 / DD5/3) TaxID=906968 RepID=F4LLL9_TREBD|nr:S41 family peptidase [Treponema brennaborense]AEE17663.1 carboxyl-terminal protease [Treponema brennaborense DSM 12168]
MRIWNKTGKKTWTGAALIAVVFSVLVFLPQVGAFAQNPAPVTEPEVKNTSEYASKRRQYIELLGSVFDFVHRNYVDEVDPAVLYEGAMKGLLDSFGDPYTSYMDTSMMRGLNDTTVGNFGGVGLSITKLNTSTPEKPAYVEVASPVEDSPGWKAGIQAGDLIVSINGTSTPEITMDEVLSMLRGTVGTSVDLVIRRGKSMEFPVTLVRALIEVPTVKYGMIGNAGYLRIIEFTPQTPERVQEALDSFKQHGFTGLVIDLRNNPGGLITSVADVADKFISAGPIVTTKSRLAYENSVYTASAKKTTMSANVPIVVLINRGSASASEILAGALKDDHLAYLVGERTFGKGSVQQPVPLPNSDGIKLTIARYYTPSDTNIDKIGIPPDMEVSFPALSEAEEKAYVELITSSVIAEYVERHPSMSEQDITRFAETLSASYPLELRVLRRLIRIETDRTKGTRLYDLDFDVQLNAALDVLKRDNFPALIAGAKTLKELQQEARLQEDRSASEE